MRTMQEIFETAVTNLLKQNAKCGEPNRTSKAGTPIPGACYYKRGDQHCGVGGTLLWDKILEKYPDFEETQHNMAPVKDDDFKPILRLSEIDTNDSSLMNMLASMQVIHDDTLLDGWRNELVYLGVEHDLDTDFIREIK